MIPNPSLQLLLVRNLKNSTKIANLVNKKTTRHNISIDEKSNCNTMQCAKLHLQERAKSRKKIINEKPRRFCQKRLVNPEHEEDVRWTDMFDRFCCDDIENNYELNETNDSGVSGYQSKEDLIFLTVQNLQFQGNIEQQRRPRTSFKYKTLPNNQKHRMFVKQIVDDLDQYEECPSSELSDYFDDYSKYFTNNGDSRPSSASSSIVLYCLSNKTKENKGTQVDLRTQQRRKPSKIDFKTKKNTRKKSESSAAGNNKNSAGIDTDRPDNIEDTKIAFHRSGKRKSLTISRTESPATVQVIRVDVVCNYSSTSSMSDYEDNKKSTHAIDKDQEKQGLKPLKLKKSRFVNKYMLTNTVKSLDQNVSNGKVTLMCKTFKLTNRSKIGGNSKETKKE